MGEFLQPLKGAGMVARNAGNRQGELLTVVDIKRATVESNTAIAAKKAGLGMQISRGFLSALKRGH
jgi:hypothetical protein